MKLGVLCLKYMNTLQHTTIQMAGTLFSWGKTCHYKSHVCDDENVCPVDCFKDMHMQIKIQVDHRVLSQGEIVIGQSEHINDVFATLKVPIVSLYNSHLEGLVHVSNFVRYINRISAHAAEKSVYSNIRNFRDRLLPTTQYPLCAVPGIAPSIINEVKKFNGYHKSTDACTSMKGISNMWLTGAYGKAIREAYSAALCDLLPHGGAVVKVLVFESDFHLIDARNPSPSLVEVILPRCNSSTSSNGMHTNEHTPATVVKVDNHNNTQLESILHQQLTVKLDDIVVGMSQDEVSLAERWMDMQNYADPLLTPDVVPMRVYTRVFRGRVCCFIRSDDGSLFATAHASSMDESTLDNTIDIIQTKTMDRFHAIQDAAKREAERRTIESKRKREDDEAESKRKMEDIEAAFVMNKQRMEFRVAQRSMEIDELKHAAELRELRKALKASSSVNAISSRAAIIPLLTLSARQVVEKMITMLAPSLITNKDEISTDYRLFPLPVIVYNAMIERLKGLNRQMVAAVNNGWSAMDVICCTIMDICSLHKPTRRRASHGTTATKASNTRPVTSSSLGTLLGLCPRTRLMYNPMVNIIQASSDAVALHYEASQQQEQHHPFANRIMIHMINPDHVKDVTKDLTPVVAERVAALLVSDSMNSNTTGRRRFFQSIRPLRVLSLDTESRAILKSSATNDRMKTITLGDDNRQYRLLEAVFTEFEWNNTSQSYEYIKGNRKQLYVRPPEGELYETTQNGHLVQDAIEKGVSELRFCEEVVRHLQEKRLHTPVSDELLLLCYNQPHERDVFASIGRVGNPVGSSLVENLLFGCDDVEPLMSVEDVHKTIQYATTCQGLKSLRLKDVWEAVVHPVRSPMLAQYNATNSPHAESIGIFGWHRATTDSRAVFEIWAVINGHSMR
jgi:hypothetical protein